MKSTPHPLAVSLSVLGLFLCSAVLTFAEVPRIISFQGQAVGANGNPLNGPFTLTFRLYNVESNGVALWTETHTNVPINRGIFAVSLGTITPLSPAFDEQYWLGIQVSTNAELAPRHRLTSAPYALRAAEADALNSNAVAAIKSDILAMVPPPSSIPRGVIVMWSGSAATIPTNGWALCDGANGTPDLRDRFIVGAGSSYSVGSSGGTVTHAHEGGSYSAASHTHTLRTRSGVGGLPHGDISDYVMLGPSGWMMNEGQDAYSGTIVNFETNPGEGGGTISGASAPASSLPPYYALAFIIKL